MKAPGAPTAEERKLAREGLLKRQRSEKLSADERRAIKLVEAWQEEETRQRIYRTIPQKHWRAMSGRQAKVINEQARRYGIPFDGATVDLYAVARALHDFLAENAALIAKYDDAEEQGQDSPALERLRQEKYLMARLDRLAKEKQLLPREAVHATMGTVAAVLRRLGEQLGRQYGRDAQELLDDALDSAARAVEGLLTMQADAAPEQPPEDPPPTTDVGVSA